MRYLTTILLVLAISTVALAEQKDRPAKKVRAPQQKKQQPNRKQQPKKKQQPQQQRLQAQMQNIKLRNAQMDLEEREMELEQRRIELDAQRKMADIKVKGMAMKLKGRQKGAYKGSQKHGYKDLRKGGHHKKMMCPIFMVIMAVVHILLSVWVYQDIRRRNRGSGLWIAVALLTGLLGTGVYAIVRIGDKEQDVLTEGA